MTEERSSEDEDVKDLSEICDAIREDLERRNAARDQAIVLSRQLIRHCSESIRAIHRRDWDGADTKLADVRSGAAELKSVVSEVTPIFTHTGYTQDALKEVAEALHHPRHHQRSQRCLPPANSISKARPISKAWAKPLLNCAASSSISCGAKKTTAAEAERLLNVMDEIYDQLVTFRLPRCAHSMVCAVKLMLCAACSNEPAAT